MDPLSQGVVGATLPQNIGDRRHLLAAGVLGFIAALTPDLDIFIRSAEDPLLFLQFHRQFTHALLFIPIGGLLCALCLHPLLGRRWGLQFRQSYLYCTLGYATHGLLDACTSYGTQLLWPLTDERFAWNTISIIDPLFTLPLLILMILAMRRRRPLFARLALSWIVMYQGVGFWQHWRVTTMGEQIAAQRGHQPLRLEVKPSFANLVLWKVIYETDDAYYTDAVRAGSELVFYPGSRIEKLDIVRDLPWLDPASQQARDIERFRWFSKGYLALDPANPYRIIDMRYSLVPNEASGMWSIELLPDAAPEDHVRYRANRDTAGQRRETFQQMLMGSYPLWQKSEINLGN